MTASWCPSEAAPPGSRCPACSSEAVTCLSACLLQLARATPRGSLAPDLDLARFQEETLGCVPTP